jgi:hypothetical protein
LLCQGRFRIRWVRHPEVGSLVPVGPRLSLIAPSDTPAEREGRKRHDLNTGRLRDAPLRRTNTITERPCTRNNGTERKPLRQSVFRRVLHKQHASVIRAFLANACFCLTFPIGSKFPSLQRNLGLARPCPHATTPCNDAKRESNRAPTARQQRQTRGKTVAAVHGARTRIGRASRQ